MFRQALTYCIVLGVISMAFISCEKSQPHEYDFQLRVEDRSLVSGDSVLKVTQGDTVTLHIESDEPITFHLHGYDLQVPIGTEDPVPLTFVANATCSCRFTIHVAGEAGHHDEESHHDVEEEIDLGRLEVMP